jgi:hypothetical protein
MRFAASAEARVANRSWCDKQKGCFMVFCNAATVLYFTQF